MFPQMVPLSMSTPIKGEEVQWYFLCGRCVAVYNAMLCVACCGYMHISSGHAYFTAWFMAHHMALFAGRGDAVGKMEVASMGDLFEHPV